MKGFPPLAVQICPSRRETAGSCISVRANAAVSSREREPSDSRLSVTSAQLVQRVPQKGGLQEILVPHGGDGEQAAMLQAPPREGQEPEAHLIGPVEVLEDQDGGLHEGHSLQELSHGLEELGGIGGGGARRRAGRDLGEQPGQLRAPDRTEAVERLAVGGETAGAQDIDPRPEREHLFRLEAPAEQDARALAAGLGDQLGDQAALADAGLAHHGDELTLACERGLQRVPEVRQLDLTAHDWRLAGQRVRVEQPFHSGARGAGVSGMRRRHRRVCREPFQDLLVQRPRLVIGFGSQLALERRHTDLVLAERGPAPPELGVQVHERPVHGLLEGVEGDQPQSGLHGLVERACVPLLGEEPGKRILGQLAQPRPLREKPLLEGRLLQREPLEQVAPVEADRLLEGFPGAAGHTLLEGLHVRGHERGLERNRLPHQPQRLGVSQDLPERVKGLAEAGPGLRLLHIPPEERGELVARVRFTEREGQVGQERLRLLDRDDERLARIEPGAKATEQGQAESCHRGNRRQPSTAPARDPTPSRKASQHPSRPLPCCGGIS